MQDIRNRLIKYKKTNKLTNEKVLLELKDVGLPVSGVTVNNWLGRRTSPSQMYRQQLENFLTSKGV